MQNQDPQLIWIALAGIAAVLVAFFGIIKATLKHGRMQAEVMIMKSDIEGHKEELKRVEDKIGHCRTDVFENLVSKPEFEGFKSEQKLRDSHNDKAHDALMEIVQEIRKETKSLMGHVQTLIARRK